MIEFARGQKGKLSDMGCTGGFPIEVSLDATGMEVDVACFGLDASGRLSDDRYMIFYNQTASPEGALRLQASGARSTFTTDLARLPDSIHKLVFAASIGGEGTMRRLGAGALQLGSARFPFRGADFQDEKAVIIGEVYRRDGVWRFAAVGQGFTGGLTALLAHFGGQEAGGPRTPAPAAPAPSAARAPLPTTPAPPGRVSLSKVTLEKRGDRISLEKGGFSTLHVRLNWTHAVDLDLHAFYRTRTGEFGHVYFADRGTLGSKPYIQLDHDAGIGNTAGANEENLRVVNLEYFSSILIATNIFRFFGFLSRGDNFAKYDGRVVVETDRGDRIVVPLISEEPGRWCIIAKIDNTGSSPAVVNINKVLEKEPDNTAL